MRIKTALPATAVAAFDAWVLPEVMRRWLFVGPSNRILEVTSDARVGGAFYIEEENQGAHIDHYGEYVRLERPALIELTLRVPLHFQGVSHLLVELQGNGDDYELTLRQAGTGPPDAAQIWRGMLSGLARVLVGKPAIGSNGSNSPVQLNAPGRA
jgi:uncharacterized protein YndB with AHSA1/START domain